MPHRVQARSLKLVAAITTVIWLACGVLGLRHEADGAHVRDRRTGALLHGHVLSGTHVDSAQSDVHGRADDQDADGAACAIDAALHQAAVPHAASPASISSAPTALAALAAPAVNAPRRRSILDHAPKTSPPAHG